VIHAEVEATWHEASAIVFFGPSWRVGVGYWLSAWTLGLCLSWSVRLGVATMNFLCFYLYAQWPTADGAAPAGGDKRPEQQPAPASTPQEGGQGRDA
jgi:hypothetical protein